ncbi:MAG: ABC transporter ATP-binding protein [Clostridia bacterium]|nr:ABC transporter ATP-binding protein [Clostridia bacterium]
MDSANLVSIRNLTVLSGQRVLIKNLDLDIREGELIGVAGESGSGKTMFILAMLNVLPEGVKITSDRFELFGKDCRTLSSSEWRSLVGSHIGFVPQNTMFYLHPMMKIKKQIIDSFVSHKKGTKEQGLARAAELLRRVGFDDPERVLNSYGWELSGGMRQRVNIAMALMNNPEILIADEPTTALDAAIQRQILDLFKDINENEGVTILMVSHDLGMLHAYSNMNMVMYAGRMVEFGPSEDIFNAPAHPYTKALLDVIPTLSRTADDRLVEIPGFVPDSGREVESCIFADRCPYAEDICRQPVSMTHIAAHHLCLCAKPLTGGDRNE